MIWASRFSGFITGPEATLSGVVKYGYFPVGSMFDDDESTDWSIDDLQRSVYHSESIKTNHGKISLQNAIVNHECGTKMGLGFGSASADNSFAAEYVTFAIIEKPMVSLAEGTNVEYTIEAVIESNYVANPRVNNAFARSLNSAGIQGGFVDGMLGAIGSAA